jgi:hypothetical protein
MRALLIGLALAAAACGNAETCTLTTCCDVPDNGMMLCTNPSNTYQTCGTLGSTVIDLHINDGMPSCSYDTTNICATGADCCLRRRDAFCGVPHTTPAFCPQGQPAPKCQ